MQASPQTSRNARKRERCLEEVMQERDDGYRLLPWDLRQQQGLVNLTNTPLSRVAKAVMGHGDLGDEMSLSLIHSVACAKYSTIKISLVLKGNRWSKVSSRAAESFDSQRSESRLHMAAACADGASRCAGGTPSKAGPWSSVTGGPPSKAGPWSSVIRAPTPSAQPTVSPAPRGLGPKLPFSTEDNGYPVVEVRYKGCLWRHYSREEQDTKLMVAENIHHAAFTISPSRSYQACAAVPDGEFRLS
ncbi:unnamed protein product [Rangifer tarandus platyrhynchus]|uniref:Uncharacterized protein n=1 Tax=Rangifer tarandus platyrhynchus TaxID=3082113 RepID=A0ABN8YTM5_RANTA|nr:unnamed protein product [Rangifer tarandus platyrhynchus]